MDMGLKDRTVLVTGSSLEIVFIGSRANRRITGEVIRITGRH